MRWFWLLVMLIVAGLSSDVAAASAATPGPLPATPGPASCQTDPVAPESLANLLATPAAATPAADLALEGVPAGEDVILPARQVIFEVFACFNAGEPLRAYSLYSDRYLRAIFARQEPDSLGYLATPSPLDRDEWTSIVDIRDVRLLDDGRVYATVILDPGLIPVQKTFGFFLVHQEGGWLVDDVLDELRFSLP